MQLSKPASSRHSVRFALLLKDVSKQLLAAQGLLVAFQFSRRRTHHLFLFSHRQTKFDANTTPTKPCVGLEISNAFDSLLKTREEFNIYSTASS